MPVAPTRSPLMRRARRATRRTLGASQSVYGNASPMALPGAARPAVPAGRGVFGVNNAMRKFQAQTPQQVAGYDDAEDTFLGRMDRYADDPLKRIAGMPGYDDLTNLQGSPALYSALHDEGINNVASAGRRARTAAKARGLHGQGVSYAALAGDAERDAYGSLNDAMLGARTSSIGQNRDFLQSLISGQADYLRGLYSDREGTLGGLTGQQRGFEQQDRERRGRKRNPIGISVGGTGFQF